MEKKERERRGGGESCERETSVGDFNTDRLAARVTVANLHNRVRLFVKVNCSSG